MAEDIVANLSSDVLEDDGRITSHDDATWILTSAFIIFTMQSGMCFFTGRIDVI